MLLLTITHVSSHFPIRPDITSDVFCPGLTHLPPCIFFFSRVHMMAGQTACWLFHIILDYRYLYNNCPGPEWNVMCRGCCEYDVIRCKCPLQGTPVGYAVPCCRNAINECDPCIIHPGRTFRHASKYSYLITSLAKFHLCWQNEKLLTQLVENWVHLEHLPYSLCKTKDQLFALKHDKQRFSST